MNQEQYQELQMLDAQLRQMQQVVENLDNQLAQIAEIKEALAVFEKTKEDAVLIPLANGIFAQGTLSKDKTLAVNVGSNVVVEKSVSETAKMMDDQIIELQNYRHEIMAQMEPLVEKLQSYQSGE